ncbi:MAG: hypothetical protein WAX69_18095 [Victivallales bacterium]
MSTATGNNKIHEFTPEEKFNLDVIMFEVDMADMAEKIQLLQKTGIPAKKEFENAFFDMKKTVKRIQSIPEEIVFCNYNCLYPDSFFLLLEWYWFYKIRRRIVLWRFNRAKTSLVENLRKLSEILQENIEMCEWARERQVLAEKDCLENVEIVSYLKKQADDYLKGAA